MINDLAYYGAAQIVERKRGQVRLRMEEVECDYFEMLSGNVDALNHFNGEYMVQYSWSEITLGNLLRTISF